LKRGGAQGEEKWKEKERFGCVMAVGEMDVPEADVRGIVRIPYA